MKKGAIEIEVLKEANPEIGVTIVNPIDPRVYFQDRAGLFVYNSFKERILSSAEAVKEVATYTIESLDLVNGATDKQIELSLGNKNVFEVNDVCAILADLIDKQKNGEDGVLLTNGYANLFYTPACVVSVCWYGGEWDVCSWDRVDGDWGPGRRVFSPQLALDL